MGQAHPFRRFVLEPVSTTSNMPSGRIFFRHTSLNCLATHNKYARKNLPRLAKKSLAHSAFSAVNTSSYLLLVLTLLVGHGTRSLARGLARGLALAAASMGRALLQGSAVQGLDMSHGYLPPFQLVCPVPRGDGPMVSTSTGIIAHSFGKFNTMPTFSFSRLFTRTNVDWRIVWSGRQCQTLINSRRLST